MQYEFAEIFDVPALTRLCEKFTRLTGKTTALLDLEQNVHISSGWQDLCRRFHAAEPGTIARCKKGDTPLARQLAAGQPYSVLQCQNGLIEVTIPIRVNGRHAGNLVTGQFFLEPPDEDRFSEQAGLFGVRPEDYIAALREAPVFSAQDVRLTLEFLVEMAQTIGEVASRSLNLRAREYSQREALQKELGEKTRTLERIYRKYNAALSVTRVGIWEWNIGTGHMYWSSETERLWGMDPGEFSNEVAQIEATIHEEDVPAWRADVERSLAGISSLDTEFRIIHPDGSVRWIHARGQLQCDFEGKPSIMSGIVFDVTERKATEAELRHSETLLRRSQKLAQLGSWEYDFRRRKLHWSEEIFRIFEIDQQSTEPDFELVIQRTHPEDREATLAIFNEALKTGQTYDVEHRLLLSGGRIKYVKELGYSTRDSKGKLLLFMGTTQDITEKKQLENEIRRAAHYDHLTGLPNRNLLVDRFRQAVAAARRTRSFGAMLYIDLDNFKPLNDTHGHDAGDMLLRQIGDRLRNMVRGTDTAARIGGDEFLVMLTDLSQDRSTAVSEAVGIGEKIHSRLCEPYWLSLRSGDPDAQPMCYQCTASIGLALFDAGAEKLEDIVQRADRAMYAVKHSGKSAVRLDDARSEAPD